MMRRHLPVLITLGVFIAGYLICLAQFPSFASTRVIGNLLTDNAFLGIVAVGMTFVILSGGIDLSVGSVIAFTGVFLAVVIERYNVNPYLAFLLVLGIAALFGAGMGLLIHIFEIPAFIVTLAGMFLARGMCFVLTTDSIPINASIYAQVTDIAFPLPGGGRLTFVAIVMLLVFAVGIVLAHFT
ncbi:MAG TPA: sugar ABC transporter permease YjfF, partial [Microvirga sp.]|nr:sugar ABC transporter permease YjfF [Microvirga sp.]